MIRELIRQHAEDSYQIHTPEGDAAVLDALNATTETKTDKTEYTIKYLTRMLGLETFGIVAEVMLQAERDNAVIKGYNVTLATVGLDFSAPEVQGMVDLLFADQSLEGIRTALKEIGIKTRSPAYWYFLNNQSGSSRDAIQEDIDEARAFDARQELHAEWTAKAAVIEDGILSDEIKTLEDAASVLVRG